jgi:hypothetical protein
MTYIELLMLIQERKETSLSQDVRCIITDKHRYIKEVGWTEDTEPGAPEKHYDRSGLRWIWKKTEIAKETI